MRVVFLGNFGVDYSSESHHALSLETMGHEVIRLQEGRTNADKLLDETQGANLLVWVHTHGWATPEGAHHNASEAIATIRSRGIPVITYHLDLWMGLNRQKDLSGDPFYRYLDYFFATDRQMCEWLNAKTSVKGVYLPAAVYHAECYISGSKHPKANDVVFVGSKNYHPEWPYRPKLIDWLRLTYGDRFTHAGGDGDTGTIRGGRLNDFYASSKIVVGDSLNIGFNYPHYWSDRVYETIGRGGFLIMPFIQGLDEQFDDGKHLVFYEYNDFADLKNKIDFYLANERQREYIRAAGHAEVKQNHTYLLRWRRILSVVFGGGDG